MTSLGFRCMIAALVSATALAACSNDPEAKPASGNDRVKVAGGDKDASESAGEASAAESDLPSPDDIEYYFEAFAARNPDDLAKAVDLAEDGSVAEAFIRYTVGIVDAAVATGASAEDLAAEIEEINGGYRVCNDGDDEDQCFDYTDVEGRDGKIVNFLSDGESFADRIALGSGSSVKVGDLGSIRLRASFQTKDPVSTIVVLDVTSNNAPITIPLSDFTYRSKDGRQFSAAEDSFGGDDLGPNSTTTVLVQFEIAKFGGDVNVKLLDEDYDDATATIPAS